MTGVIKRGLLAGAAGTTLLNATTYLDMAVRGRGESDTPGRTIDALLKKAGRDLPGSSDQRAARRTALGALSGIASGLGIGVAASAVRASGVRLPQVLGAVATGAGAMVGTNLPMTVAGITDPRVWTAADWVSDAVPHLAYGVGTHAVIVAQDSGAPAPRPSAGLIAALALAGPRFGNARLTRAVGAGPLRPRTRLQRRQIFAGVESTGSRRRIGRRQASANPQQARASGARGPLRLRRRRRAHPREEAGNGTGLSTPGRCRRSNGRCLWRRGLATLGERSRTGLAGRTGRGRGRADARLRRLLETLTIQSHRFLARLYKLRAAS